MKARLKVRWPIIACLVLGAAGLVAAATPAGVTHRVSIASDGTEGDGASYGASIDALGRIVAFYSYADDLVAGDSNGVADVFIHDTDSGDTTRVSVASDGTQANGASYTPHISATGRIVAFYSHASNLVAGDANGAADVFVHDTDSGDTTRVSVASDGAQGNGGSYAAHLNEVGRIVAFYSCASNLVPGDTNSAGDIFVRDLDAQLTTRVSVASNGTQANDTSYAPHISAMGRIVAFYSCASNLVAGDANGAADVFVHDTDSGDTTRVSVASDGTQANDASSGPAISANGRYVAFHSLASNLVAGDTNDRWDVFVHDRQTGQTTRVSVASDESQANAWSAYPALSADGRYVAFHSAASNLVAGDTNGSIDVFVRDTVAGTTARLSVASGGAQANSWSAYPAISGDGRFVGFESPASNLVSGDGNGSTDVFLSQAALDGTRVLSSGYVTPSSGDASTRFTWRMKYWNTLGFLPDAVWLAIWSASTGTTQWGAMWPLDPYDWGAADGKWFTYSAYTTGGGHAFRCAALTGDEWVYWPQPAGSYSAGPDVNPVVLSSGYLAPTSGTHSTEFTWRVKYWNTVGAAPDEVWCAIWWASQGKAFWYQMWALDPSDTNCRDGKWYTLRMRWLDSSGHAYRFAARQGANWAYWPKPAGSYVSGPSIN